MGVLPHRSRPAHVRAPPAGRAAAIARHAGECGFGRQWRALAHEPVAGSQPAGGGCRDHDPAGRNACHRRLPGGQAGCTGVCLGPRIADGADAAANPRRAVARHCPARGLRAAVPLPLPSHPAPGCGGPGQQRAGTRRAHGGVHHLAAGAGIHPPGLAHAVCTARATGAQHGRLVQPRTGISQHAPQRTADCQRGRAGDQRAGAHAAALPALLAGQPD